MGKPKDIAWGQVDIDPKNESVVCCKHCKAKLLIGSGRDQSVSAVKKHLNNIQNVYIQYIMKSYK